MQSPGWQRARAAACGGEEHEAEGFPGYGPALSPRRVRRPVGGIFGAMHLGRQRGSAQSWGPNPEQDLWVQDPHGDPPGSKRRCRAGEVGLANPAPKRSGFSSKERKGGGLKTKEAIYWQADSPGKSDIKVKNRRLRKGES